MPKRGRPRRRRRTPRHRGETSSPAFVRGPRRRSPFASKAIPSHSQSEARDGRKTANNDCFHGGTADECHGDAPSDTGVQFLRPAPSVSRKGGSPDSRRRPGDAELKGSASTGENRPTQFIRHRRVGTGPGGPVANLRRGTGVLVLTQQAGLSVRRRAGSRSRNIGLARQSHQEGNRKHQPLTLNIRARYREVAGSWASGTQTSVRHLAPSDPGNSDVATPTTRTAGLRAKVWPTAAAGLPNQSSAIR